MAEIFYLLSKWRKTLWGEKKIVVIPAFSPFHTQFSKNFYLEAVEDGFCYEASKQTGINSLPHNPGF